MAIQIHIRIRESDWDSEEEIAQLIADEIDTFTNKHRINIPVLIIPVQDPENEMESIDSNLPSEIQRQLLLNNKSE